MDHCVELLEGFISELLKYCESYEDTNRWYENMKQNLIRDQELQRVSNEESIKRQQSDFKQMQERSVRERDAKKQKIRSTITKKEVLLEQNLKGNIEIRDAILAKADKIVRPEYFRYAYRYREYGDFHPQITKLEDFSTENLDELVEKINDKKTAMWLNRLKALLRSEDMLLEYAEFANLLGKARYLCEVENDALREQARTEIMQLKQQVEELDSDFMVRAEKINKKKQQVSRDNAEFQAMFHANCENEKKHLKEDYRNRQLKGFEALRSCLKKQYCGPVMKDAYEALAEADRQGRRLICADGSPLRVKLGSIWQNGDEALQNTNVKMILEREYPFMIQEGRFSIPGIA